MARHKGLLDFNRDVFKEPIQTVLYAHPYTADMVTHAYWSGDIDFSEAIFALKNMLSMQYELDRPMTALADDLRWQANRTTSLSGPRTPYCCHSKLSFERIKLRFEALILGKRDGTRGVGLETWRGISINRLCPVTEEEYTFFLILGMNKGGDLHLFICYLNNEIETSHTLKTLLNSEYQFRNELESFWKNN